MNQKQKPPEPLPQEQLPLAADAAEKIDVGDILSRIAHTEVEYWTCMNRVEKGSCTCTSPPYGGPIRNTDFNFSRPIQCDSTGKPLPGAKEGRSTHP